MSLDAPQRIKRYLQQATRTLHNLKDRNIFNAGIFANWIDETIHDLRRILTSDFLLLFLLSKQVYVQPEYIKK
jgi:hypothetical protein